MCTDPGTVGYTMTNTSLAVANFGVTGVCADGYSGNVEVTACTTPGAYSVSGCTNLCSPNPCQNGGSCVPGSGPNYSCVCESGYSGTNCASSVCDPNPCQNGGSCNVVDGSARCDCVDGFTGDTCQDAPDPCMYPNLIDCGSNGNCVNGNCECESGYKGDRCEIHCVGENGPYRFFGPAGFEAPVDFHPNGVRCVGDEASGYARCKHHVLDLPFTIVQDSSTGTPECPATLSCDKGDQRYTDTPEFAGLCNAFRDAANFAQIQGDKITRVVGQDLYGGYLLPGIPPSSGYNQAGSGSPYSSSNICNSGKWMAGVGNTSGEGGGIVSPARRRGECSQPGTCNYWRPALSDHVSNELNEIPRLIQQHCAASCFCEDGLNVEQTR